jgi:hypothetical protein
VDHAHALAQNHSIARPFESMEKQAVHDGAEGWMLEGEATHHVAPERHVVRDQTRGRAIARAAPHAVEDRGDLA